MTWKIVADSSCDLQEGLLCVPEVSFSIVPLKIRVGEREFVDDPSLDVAEMMRALADYQGPSSSACPSPEEWAAEFETADNTIVIAMTSALSGTYNSALVARDMVLEKHPEKKIHVIDTRSTGGHMVLLARKVNQLIAMGLSFEEVCEEADAYNQQTHLLFALASFDNLVKNGRMNKVVGLLASKLNMRAVGIASEKGELSLLHKTRGEARCITLLLEELASRKDLTGKPVVITHCQNPVGAKLLRLRIEEQWPGVEVTVLATHGLTSYYAQHQGLLIGF